jgi:hypothetical protein
VCEEEYEHFKLSFSLKYLKTKMEKIERKKERKKTKKTFH